MSRFVLTAQLQLQAPNNVAQVVRQIQSQLNNVSVNVQVQGSAQAQRQLQQVTAQTQAATSAVDRMGRAFAVSVRRFAAFSIATRAVGLFTSTLSDAVKTAIDFEREMVRVSQVTGESLTQLKGFAKTVTNLSTNLGVASSDLVQAGQLILQAGFSAKETEVALKTLAKAALAPNFDSLSETTEGAIAILAQFGEGVGALEKQLGSINAVAGAFAVEAGDLIDVIRRAGGVFKSSGGDLNELIALFTSVRATTRESAESIGTGLRTIFTRIQRPKTIEFLKQFGVELLDLEGKFVGPFEAVKRLSGALAGLGEGDVTFIRIAEELGGFRQIGKVLPLIQQFSTAQAALNVAQKAGNSLTKDAETAQQALAVRIIKVKEEFLALVRGITETKTFQIMANTALSFASALIQIGEAIKPLLPMLATLAAVNLAKGIGPFLGSFARGMSSNRTFNKGGKVHHFARGGMVPGTGNRDTVPAMLSPGEFVIRKSSVNKLGAGNLAAMNENRFKDGGAMTTAEKLAAARAQSITQNPNRAKTKSYNDGQQSAVRFSVADGNIGAFFMNPEGATDGSKSFKQQSFDITNSKILSLPGISPKEVRLKDKKGNVLPRMATDKQKFSAKGILEAGNISTFYPSFTDVSKGSLSSIIESNVKQKLSEAVVDTANFISGNKLLDIPPIDANDALMRQTAAQRIQADTGAIKTTAGYLFEGVVDAITGARPASSNAVFDFPATSLQGNRKRLGALFGNMAGISGLKQADAKASYSSKIIDGGPGSGSISSKIINSINNGVLAGIKVKAQKRHFGGIISKFATGGGVGTDTIPALLTPGEFVVNRSSAQRIGYGNLNRMNKVGRYAKGGVVQKFAQGTTGTGAKPKGDVLFQNIALNSLKPADRALTRFVLALDDLSLGGFFQLGKLTSVIASKFAKVQTVTQQTQSQLVFLNSVIPGFSKAIEANSKANRRSGARNADLISAISEHILNLYKSGASQQQLAQAANKYVNQLNQNTALLQKGASVPQLAGVKPPPVPPATTPSNPFASMTGTMGARSGGTGSSGGGTPTGNNASGGRGVAGIISDNKMFAASMAASLVQGFLPAVDESSGLLVRMSHSLLSLTTTITSVGFALEAFGLSLSSGTIINFLSGKGLDTQSVFTFFRNFGASKGLSGVLTSITQAASKFLGPIAGATAAFFAIQMAGNSLVEAFMNYEGRIKKSIESGNVEQARKLGSEQQVSKTATSMVAGGVSGAILGSFLIPILGPLGPMLGAQLGTLLAASFSDLPEYAGQVAATGAALSASQKALTKASEDATKALSDFEKGNISATDILKNSSGATTAVARSRSEANKLQTVGDSNRDSMIVGGLRNVFTLGGLLGETTGQKDARITAEQTKSRKEVMKQEEEVLRIAQPGMNALAKQVAMTGGTFDDLMNKIRETDPELYNILIRQGTNDLNKSFQNIAKEAARTKAALEATNLGLRGAQATSTAMSASMNRFAAGLEVGGNMFVANTEFLSQAMTSAAQSMNPDDIKAAVTDVSKNLSNMGVSKKFTDKFEGNTNAFIQAQQNYGKAFDNIIAESKAMGKVFSADELKTKFADQLGNMMGPNVSEDAKKNLKAIIENIDLNPDEINQIMSGNYQAFGDKLTEAGQKQFEEIMKIAQERQKAEQAIIQLTQQRIEAERNLVNAQREAVDLYMEGRDVQARYGGQAVNPAERRAAILARANAGAARMGLGQMRTGSAAELRARNNQILTGFGGIEARRSVQGGMQGAEGANATAIQQDLQQAQKDQVQTIRDLIKLEEEELKIIQEKNKLEKDSLESLISGDIEKFFEQQAAVGAQAAIATGDMGLANMFGASAIGAAFKDIQRMQEAGVQSLFGRQLDGPGGLSEQAAGAALGARGVMDPRMAQRLAGTTAEEEATKARLRELGGVLGEAGAVGAAMAEMQVQTASINIGNATLELQQIEERGRQAAQGLSRGGTVYASRGIFVPRGTDTVPAMLTPGEFVVRREAVNRGNNLQLLRAINNGGNAGGFARGGKVGYYNNGGMVQYKALGDLIARAGQAVGISPQIITNLGNVFTSFTNSFNESIKNLQNTKLQVKLDSVNVNVNLNGTSMLTQISEQTRKDIVGKVIDTLRNEYGIGNNGKLTQNTSNLAKPGQGA